MKCEGMRRYGGAFTLGPVRWEACKEPAEVMLTVKQEGEVETLPACKTCWKEVIENKIEVLKVEPL
jgi:hypothetical protein